VCNQNACSCASQPPVLPPEIEYFPSGEIQATAKPAEISTCNRLSESPASGKRLNHPTACGCSIRHIHRRAHAGNPASRSYGRNPAFDAAVSN
jgi:hypothetical protein